MRLPASALLFLLAVVCQGQQDEEARTALLSRVLGTMRHALARMPDYTCTENITRSIGDGTPLRVRTLERLRLQVAIIGGKELFSWPGAAPFERDNPYDIVGGGLAGTGDFAGFSRAVFGSDAAQFTTGEEEVGAEKRTVRYDYIVPLTSSGYVLRSGADSAVVDYAGSFWVDPATERVLALQVEADYRRHHIPYVLDMFDVKTLLDFKDILIGGEALPFPDSSTLTVVHLRNSVVSNNRIEFTGCRQYAAESSIEFGEHDTAAPAASAPPLAAELPDGLDFEVTLEEPIRASSSAAGDAISAVLRHAVKAGTLRIPKGARLVGRILGIETDLDKDATHVRLGFSHLETEGRYFPFRARFVTSGSAPGVAEGGPHRAKWINLRDIRNADRPEWMTRTDFTLIGKEGQMAKGFRMEWTTISSQNPKSK
jgi:hypothetical protein